MKNKRWLIAGLAILTVFAMLACSGSGDNGSPYVPVDTSFDPSVLHPLRASVPDDFIRGADISNCLEIEQHGGVYRNFNGQVEDIMKILTDNGVNYVRLRLWIEPDRHPEHYPGDGNNNLETTKIIAARAKAAGMKFLLDYHYSDWWADPQNQQIPYMWKDITNIDDFYMAVFSYTKETIEELIAAGAKPDMVQLGNEIRSGFLRDHAGTSRINPDDPDDPENPAEGAIKLSTWPEWSTALDYGASAVRSVDPNIKIMIQFDSGGDSGILSTFENFTRRDDNGRNGTYANVDYDVIGLSWYPFWSSHKPIDDLYTNIKEFKRRFSSKEVVICESGYSWTLQNFDSMGNYVGMAQENSSAPYMSNINGFTSDSGVQFGYRPDGTKYLPSTPENQARVYRAFMDAVVAAGGDGVMWWGADWIAPVPGLRSNSEMATLFDNTGKALPVLKVLGGITGADVREPGVITNFNANSTNGTVVLSWDKVNEAIAYYYQVDRALAEDGPWIVVDDTLDGGGAPSIGSYEDMGLANGTTYYYRIRAFNDNGWGKFCDPVAAESFIPTGLSIITTTDAATLTWDRLIGASKYGVQRAASAEGPWTTVADNVTVTTYTDTGLSPVTTYYYRINGFSDAWGDYGDPVSAETQPLVAPEYFRVTGAAADSTTLGWLPVDDAISYGVYGVQAATEPADDSAYAQIDVSITDITYTHSGLTAGQTWWYKVNAVYDPHGPGPLSEATSFTVGEEVDLTASVDMTSGSLDFAFSDSQKAASTTSIKPKADSSALYTFNALYVANDADNLYIAMEVPLAFGAYRYDRIVFLVDNTASTADTGKVPAGLDDRVCLVETITGTVEARVSLRLGDWADGPQGVEGASTNVEWVEDTASNVYKPVVLPGSPQVSPPVLKFAIPLAGIDNASKGTTLRVFAAFSMGWEEGADTYPGSFAPQDAVTDFYDVWASPAETFIEIDMNNALAYTVK